MLNFLYLIEKATYSIPTAFVGRADTTSILTTVVGRGIPTMLVGTVYMYKSCLSDILFHLPELCPRTLYTCFLPPISINLFSIIFLKWAKKIKYEYESVL